MNQDKYLNKAIKTLGVSFSIERNPMSLEDLNTLINEEKMTLSEAESGFIELKEAIEILKVNIQTLEAIKHQVKVERYKDLNDKKDIDIF